MDNDYKKMENFGLKYDIWDDEKKTISYNKSVLLVQKYLYYNLEQQYEIFMVDFYDNHDINIKHRVPPKLNFQELKSGKNNTVNLSLGDIRRYKIDQVLKNLEQEDNETNQEI